MQKLLLKNRLIFFRHLCPSVSLLKYRMIFKVLPMSKYFTIPNINNLPRNLSKNPHKTGVWWVFFFFTSRYCSFKSQIKLINNNHILLLYSCQCSWPKEAGKLLLCLSVIFHRRVFCFSDPVFPVCFFFFQSKSLDWVKYMIQITAYLSCCLVMDAWWLPPILFWL